LFLIIDFEGRGKVTEIVFAAETFQEVS